VTNLMSERARRMRREKDDAEHRLWRALRDLNRRGFQFRQQAPIGPYIADFCDHTAKLVLEVDGSQHGLPKVQSSDQWRTRWLESQGYREQRFWNHEVLINPEGVEVEILIALGVLREDGQDAVPTTNAIPSPQRRRRAFGANAGEGKGGGDCRTTAVGSPPTPNPSPQGGGELAPRLPRRRKIREARHV
jgi:very-short-patch-repair endonuclease